jgi:DNA-binding transcriptional regulator YhcF (GntR family)
MPPVEDPDDTRPLFRRVIDDIRKRVENRQLNPGDQLPGANQLAEEYGYAHMTVQRALQELKRDGILFSVKGKGTFIHPKALERTGKGHGQPAAAKTVTIETDAQYRTVVAQSQAAIKAAFGRLEAALATGIAEDVVKAQGDVERIMVDTSPAIVATELYAMRKLAQRGTQIDPAAKTTPSPGIETVIWAASDKLDPTSREREKRTRQRQAHAQEHDTTT